MEQKKIFLISVIGHNYVAYVRKFDNFVRAPEPFQASEGPGAGVESRHTDALAFGKSAGQNLS